MTSPTPMLAAAFASIPDAATLPAREATLPVSRVGFKDRAPGAAPTATLGALLIRTREKAAEVLERVAVQHWNGEIDDEVALLVVRDLTLPGSLTGRWARFLELAHALYLRNGINENRVDYREVADDLTCSDPSTEAFNIACGRVDDALAALLGGDR